MMRIFFLSIVLLGMVLVGLALQNDVEFEASVLNCIKQKESVDSETLEGMRYRSLILGYSSLHELFRSDCEMILKCRGTICQKI